ncbi:hypothetical protein CAMSH0001_1040 [Campylobacter showae RM3277]|uniref:Uncharacterized protein n=1 Tax=Campylobacter showae RM3277 TaxID=553219 RepID=C6RHT7_9BACT|nr:hypothetical protein CAMSH0001_1040 [Campylobacter showae RM3277]
MRRKNLAKIRHVVYQAKFLLAPLKTLARQAAKFRLFAA